MQVLYYSGSPHDAVSICLVIMFCEQDYIITGVQPQPDGSSGNGSNSATGAVVGVIVVLLVMIALITAIIILLLL